MASVESLKHFAEPPNVVDPITLLESRQNHEVSTLTNTPNLPSAIKGAPSVKIGNIIDNASLKGILAISVPDSRYLSKVLST